MLNPDILVEHPTPRDFDRFWRKVEKPANDEDCWKWTGSTNKRTGYGEMWYHGKLRHAHRISYRLHFGPLEPFKVCDHQCNNRWCVNPSHIKLTDQRENCTREGVESPHGVNKRKTHCIHGHPLSGDNIVWITARQKRSLRPTITRVCLTCYPHVANSSLRVIDITK